MARLGELLIAAQLVPTEKVERALRAQVVWGGRLGTNLIELGCIDLDGLSRALGQQHNLPAALERHFSQADSALQARLPAEVARAHSVVPLVRLGDDRIAVVACDPLGPDALSALASAFGVNADAIVSSVAAEMRVLYQLERIYQIARPARFLRSRTGRVATLPQFDNVPVEIDTDDERAVPITVDERAHPTGRAERAPGSTETAEAMVQSIDQALASSAAERPTDDGASGRDRRTYLRTLGDVEAPPASAPSPDAEIAARATTRPVRSAREPEAALGRIALRKVAASAANPASAASATVAAAAASDDPDALPTSLPEATRAIRRGTNRDRVAQLVTDAIEDFVPTCQAALLLVVRGDVALAWKHFSRVKNTTPDVAVPLDKPGLIPTALDRKSTTRCLADDLGAVDTLLLHAINDLVGDLVIVPILVGDQVMCLLAGSLGAGDDVAPLETVASAAGAAFARLIRDARR